MMIIENKFNISDKVFLDTDTEQKERIVIELIIRNEGISYGLSCGTEVSYHFDFEIKKEKNILKNV